MSKSSDAKPCPDLGMKQVSAGSDAVLSAHEVIAGISFRNWRKENIEAIKFLITLLSDRSLTIQEIREVLSSHCPDYKSSLKFHLIKTCWPDDKRVFGQHHRLWFVCGTVTDVTIRKQCENANHASSPKTAKAKKSFSGCHRFLQVIMVVLQGKSLTLSQLTDAVSCYPGIDTSQLSRAYLSKRIFAILKHNSHLFFRVADHHGQIPVRNARWKIIQTAGTSKGRRNRARPKRDALYAVMMSKWRIRGWSFDELVEEILQPASAYTVKAGISLKQLRRQLHNVVHYTGRPFFGRAQKGQQVKWRALWLGKTKIPTSPSDFDLLVSQVINDLGLVPELDVLLSQIKLFGHLWGWDAIALPSDYMQGQVVKAMGRVLDKDMAEIMPDESDQAVDMIITGMERRRESGQLLDSNVEELLSGLELPEVEEVLPEDLEGLTITDRLE